jgi:hypothetical protein
MYTDETDGTKTIVGLAAFSACVTRATLVETTTDHQHKQSTSYQLILLTQYDRILIVNNSSENKTQKKENIT